MDSIAIYSSDGDDEDTNFALRYREIRDNSDIFKLSDRMFLSLFRLSKVAVKYILDELQDSLTVRGRGTSIPNILKLAATLRFCAQGSYQTSVGQDFLIGMSQSTISVMMSEVVTAIETKLCSKWISFRQSNTDIALATNFFFNKTGFPGVIACVDGTHVNIVRPVVNEHYYFNRKGHHSINAMIVCDHRMRIMAVDSRYGGASHDSLIWSLSTYRQHLQRNHTENCNYWVLDDSGYPLEPWLITPFRAADEGSREAAFNTKHSKTRNVVERTIGLLKARFRCLLGARELHYNPKKASQIINVCCCLHNICLHFNVPYEFEDETLITSQQDVSDSLTNETENNRARTIRQNICNSII